MYGVENTNWINGAKRLLEYVKDKDKKYKQCPCILATNISCNRVWFYFINAMVVFRGGLDGIVWT